MENFGLLRLLNSALFSGSDPGENTNAENGKNPFSVLARLLPDNPSGENGNENSQTAAPPPPPQKEFPKEEFSSNAFLSLMERHERTSKKIDANEHRKR